MLRESRIGDPEPLLESIWMSVLKRKFEGLKIDDDVSTKDDALLVEDLVRGCTAMAAQRPAHVGTNQ